MATTNTGNNSVTVLEHSRVSPPPGAVPGTSLPLTFLDAFWLNLPIHRLLLYHFPYSTAYFTQTTVPNIKSSLSQVLKHYFPFAGNLVSDSGCSKPEIRYVDGDSVSVTFAECTNDFNYLTGNHARDVDELFPLLPRLPPVDFNEPGGQVSSLLAVQVTLFSNHGIAIGISYEHIVGDGRTMFNFIRAWASIAKLGGDAPPSLLPFYDRSLIKDPKGLYDILRSELHEYKQKVMQQKRYSQPQQTPSKQQVQATFIMHRADIQELKNLVSTKRPTLKHVSSFMVVCAYLWSCITRTRAAIGMDFEEDELEQFGFVFDCRGRLGPPIPEAYFGNCVGLCATRTVKRSELIGEEGIVTAAELIGEQIQKKLYNKEGVLSGAEMWVTQYDSGLRMPIGVAGSPKFDYYKIDFGWGKLRKTEIVGRPLSLSSCKDSAQGDLEIGLCFSKDDMDAFAPIFAKGLVR